MNNENSMPAQIPNRENVEEKVFVKFDWTLLTKLAQNTRIKSHVHENARSHAHIRKQMSIW